MILEKQSAEYRMKNEPIIDKEFFSGWANYVFHENEIKWRGKPKIDRKKLEITKLLFVVVISIMSIYLIDFFILPSKKILDSGNSVTRNYVESGNGRPSEDMGGQYVTQNRNSFNTRHYYHELSKGELELQVSPIFKIVKEVKNNRMDYSDRLSSSLNHLITKCAFFIAYLVIIGGFLIIRNKSIIDSELLMKVVLSSLGFLGLFYLFWKIHN